MIIRATYSRPNQPDNNTEKMAKRNQQAPRYRRDNSETIQPDSQIIFWLLNNIVWRTFADQ